jgi:hypothetical protein
MLKREVAEKQLNALRIKNWDKKVLEAVGKLPEKLASIGRTMRGVADNGKAFKNWSQRQAAEQKAAPALAALSVKDRTRLFATFHPQLAEDLERVYQFVPKQTLPGKPFRAPNDPKLYTERAFGALRNLIQIFDGFDQNVAWCAAWAPHLSGGWVADEVGLLLAAAIDAGNEEVLEILRLSVTNEHEVGSMGRHVVSGMLMCSRPDAWEYMEKTLLAAQRQEGLRQSILSEIDEAHPEAFRQMLGLILEHNLIRFSSVVQAVDNWFELNWSALSPGIIKRTVQLALDCLNDADKREQLLANGEGEDAYLALWCCAFDDVRLAFDRAVAMLGDSKVERRAVALRILSELSLDEEATPHYVALLEDPDLRIALEALQNLPAGGDHWDAILRLRDRLPTKATVLEPLVWPWNTVEADRRDVVGRLFNHMDKHKIDDLIPFMGDLNGWQKAQLIEKLAKRKNWTTPVRETLFKLVGDRDSYVRRQALEALKKCEVNEQEAQAMEGLLSRKGSEMRQGVLSILVRQKAAPVLQSVDRLLTSKKEPLRLGGLELMRLLVEKKKAVSECRERAKTYQATKPELGEDEQLHLEVIFDVQREKPTLDNALGLMDPTKCSPRIAPKDRKVTFVTPAAVALVQSLDELIHKHRKTPVRLPNEHIDTLLGNMNYWQFPNAYDTQSREKNLERLPLAEVWTQWYENRPKALRDKDGLELTRAMLWVVCNPAMWKAERARFPELLDRMTNKQTWKKLRHPDFVERLLTWLDYLYPNERTNHFGLDALETAYSLVPAKERERVVKLDDWRQADKDWRKRSPALVVRRVLGKLTPEQSVRLWQLEHWFDQPAPGVGRMRANFSHLLEAFKAGQANEHDVYDALIGPGITYFHDLSRLTMPQSKEVQEVPALRPIVEAVRERILEIETKRGEMPTAATPPAHQLSGLFGIGTFFRIWNAFGKRKLARVSYFGQSKPETLTRLLSVTYPAKGDTPEAFAQAVRSDKLSDQELLEVAFLAPQWLPFIEPTMKWQGLTEGVWWFLAHMPSGKSGLSGAQDAEDFDEDLDEEKLDHETESTEAAPAKKIDPWENIVRERCGLTAEERRNGAVAPEWFHRVYPVLGAKRWDALATAAKFGSHGNDAKKAVKLSEVLLGKVSRSQLMDEVNNKKLKESVRLLGLLPLPEGDKREKELTIRYKALVEYRRYAKSLGAMSREGAVATANMGLENLARTAGYPDPIRLEWSMEATEYADLAGGSVSVTDDGVTVTLSIDALAVPEVSIRRGEKPLKTIPPAVRKNAQVAELLEKRTELKRSASRVKQSLEHMMIRGDHFSGEELVTLFSHPLLRPLLERLVVEGEGIRGYPTAQGQALRDHAGKMEPVKKGEKLRLSHPHDLFGSKEWHLWQAECFAAERVQPIKQVFRELYVLSAQEKDDATFSTRYAGQQVNPTQAMALFGSRGWSVNDGICKFFPEVGLRVEVDFQHHGWTPAQVEGATIDAIRFYQRGEWNPMRLADVPPRIFSEVMRDGDLVVAVAHVGGVDPEASASTVEMRSALVRETVNLFRLENVQVKDRHVFIKGTLGGYSVHLGSANVHRQPGGAVCILPVHSQHHGRLFLPFADADPRTAEVVSKILLLARDHEIQDPSILDQLR